MKLIYAIISNEDSSGVLKKLMAAGFSATKLASTGGFLMAGNTTVITVTQDELVDDAIGIIKANSRRRTKMIPPPPYIGAEFQLMELVEVAVGGATIFVTNVERFEKV